MYEIKRGSKFKKSYKRIIGSGNFKSKIFEHIVGLLIQGKEVGDQYHDHALKGDSFGLRECHIYGDCLLIYEISRDEKYIRLIDIGNHANLFE